MEKLKQTIIFADKVILGAGYTALFQALKLNLQGYKCFIIGKINENMHRQKISAGPFYLHYSKKLEKALQQAKIRYKIKTCKVGYFNFIFETKQEKIKNKYSQNTRKKIKNKIMSDGKSKFKYIIFNKSDLFAYIKKYNIIFDKYATFISPRYNEIRIKNQFINFNTCYSTLHSKIIYTK